MAPSRELARLKPPAPDKRVAASLTLLGVLVCAAPLLTQRAARSMPSPAAHAASNRLAEASPPRVVKRVDAVPAGTPCEQRAWPNFDAKCPGPAGQPVAATVAPAPQVAATPAPAQSVPAAGAAQGIVQGAALASAPMPLP